MQVYLLTWPGQIGQPDAFRNFQDIEPSIRISYGQAKDLKIISSPRATGGPIFTVSGDMPGSGSFEEQITVTRLSVYDSPTHI